MTIELYMNTCGACSRDENCPTPIVYTGDSGPSFEAVVTKDGVGRPADLEGYEATAKVYFPTRLYYPITATDTEVTLWAGEDASWPAVGDKIHIIDATPEVLTVTAVVSSTGIFTVTRGVSPAAHLEDSDVEVIRVEEEAATIESVFNIDEFTNQEWLLRTVIQLDFTPEITVAPGLFFIRFTLTDANGLTVRLPRSSGFKVLFAEN